MIIGIDLTVKAIPVVLLYGICITCGYVFYVLSLKKLPVGLTALIESGSLFAYLIIDAIVGYIKITPYFVFLFIIFIISVVLFTSDTYKIKESIKNKEIKIAGVIILLISMLFYGFEPYIIKLANNNGANEVSINIGYYVIAIPYFFYMFKKTKKDAMQSNHEHKTEKNNIFKYILLIAIFESLYCFFGTMGYIEEAPVINAIIQEIRVFLLVILSVIAKTDRLTINKVIALILGIASVIGIYLY